MGETWRGWTRERALCVQLAALAELPSLLDAERTFEGVEGTLENAERTHEKAVQTLENGERSLEKAVQTLENAERSLETAERTLENAERSLETAERTLENAERSLETAERTLGMPPEELHALEPLSRDIPWGEPLVRRPVLEGLARAGFLVDSDRQPFLFSIRGGALLRAVLERIDPRIRTFRALRDSQDGALGPQAYSALPRHVFCIGAEADRSHYKTFSTQCRPMERDGGIRLSSTYDQLAGADPGEALPTDLSSARAVVWLISPDFLADERCYTLAEASRRQSESGQSVLLPIRLRPSYREEPLLNDLQCLPRKGPSVTQVSNRDAAWCDIVSELTRLMEA